MKSAILFTIALLTASSSFAGIPGSDLNRGRPAPNVPGQPSSAPVLTAKFSDGFVMKPVSREFTLTNDGIMTLVVRHMREDETETLVIGKLSAEMMAKVNAKISAIDASAKLVDEQEGQPKCSDAPYQTTAIYQAGVAKEIARSSMCHQFSLASYEAQSLAALAGANLQF